MRTLHYFVFFKIISFFWGLSSSSVSVDLAQSWRPTLKKTLTQLEAYTKEILDMQLEVYTEEILHMQLEAYTE